MPNNEFDTNNRSNAQSAPSGSDPASENGGGQSDTTAIPDVQPQRHHSETRPQDEISEIFKKESTVRQIKSVLALFFVTGFGIGIAGYAVVGSPDVRGIFEPAIITLALLGPILGVIAGLQTGSILSGELPSQVYATVAVSTAGGHLLFFVVAFILITANVAAPVSFSNYFVPCLIGAIGTAAAGCAAVYTTRT